MKIIKIFLAIILFYSFNAYSQNNGVNQNFSSAIFEITQKKGSVTKSEYDKFWKSLGIIDQKQKLIAIGLIRNNFVLTQTYNKYMWECAEEAWSTNIVPDCRKAKDALNSLKINLGKDSQDLLKPFEINFKNLLEASAKKKPFKMYGSEAYSNISLEGIRVAKSQIETTLQRLDQVLKADYTPN